MADLHLERLGIRVIPESIGGLTIRGNLNLERNELQTLPESIGFLTLEGSNLALTGTLT